MRSATVTEARALARAILLLTLVFSAALGGAGLSPERALASDLAMNVPGDSSAIYQQGDPVVVAPQPNTPMNNGVCPQEAPIKGASMTEDGERFFFTPNDLVYEATMPERCFANEGAAASAGYQHGR